jgi:GDP-4-dehydro-6-deoxy-D-mannose reductase
VKILVTGAGGFVGQWLVPRLLQAGHEVIGGLYPVTTPPEQLPEGQRRQVRWLPLDLRDTAAVRSALTTLPEVVVHLAALASGSDARRDPGLAWEVNAGGTARLAEGMAQLGSQGAGPLLLAVSTGEVYGAAAGIRPSLESDPTVPCSPYAASKLGAEIAALEVHRRTGLRVVIARAFPHTGPGQGNRYVVPAFAERLIAARRLNASVVKTGNLEPVRDFLDVRDVVNAYLQLVERGQSGQIYNVARGEGVSLLDIFTRLARLVGVQATPEVDAELTRPSDIPRLVGDAGLLRTTVGWSPQISLDQTLADLVHAQTH